MSVVKGGKLRKAKFAGVILMGSIIALLGYKLGKSEADDRYDQGCIDTTKSINDFLVSKDEWGIYNLAGGNVYISVYPEDVREVSLCDMTEKFQENTCFVTTEKCKVLLLRNTDGHIFGFPIIKGGK